MTRPTAAHARPIRAEAARRKRPASRPGEGGPAAGVAFLINALDAAGAEKQVILTARTLAEEGYATAICTLAVPRGGERVEGLLADAESKGVQLIRGRGPAPWIVGSVAQCARWLAQSRGRILWTWGNRADALGAVLCGRRIPRICALRSASAEAMHRRASLWRWLDRTCTRYVSNSHLNVRQLGEIVPGVERRARVLYNAMEPADLAHEPVVLPAARPPRVEVVMLGNLRVHAKGYDLAVEAMRRVRAEGLPVHLRIAGAPREGEQLRALITRAGMSDAIDLVGAVARPVEFLRSGHVFALLSRYEGLPNALLEAMAVGLPCLATTVGDLAELTRDGVHVRHVAVGNVEAAVEVLKATLADWPAARRLGGAARAFVHEQFSPDAFRQRLWHCLDGVLPGMAGRAGAPV